MSRHLTCTFLHQETIIFFLLVLMQTVFCSFSDSRSRVNLPEIPGDALSLYINANFLKVNLKVESLF